MLAHVSAADFMNTYEAATREHDLEATLSLIAEDAVYLFSNQSSHIGKTAVAKAIKTNFDAIKAEAYALQNLKWLATAEDVAVCVYEFTWAGEINGKPASGGGRGTTVLRRTGDTWEVAHEHLSAGKL